METQLSALESASRHPSASHPGEFFHLSPLKLPPFLLTFYSYSPSLGKTAKTHANTTATSTEI